MRHMEEVEEEKQPSQDTKLHRLLILSSVLF